MQIMFRNYLHHYYANSAIFHSKVASISTWLPPAEQYISWKLIQIHPASAQQLHRELQTPLIELSAF